MRLTEARYDDDEGETFTGGPDPLEVAQKVFDQHGDMPNSGGLSTLFTTWGQFLDHDIVFTPEGEDAGLLDVNGMPHEIHRSDFEIGEDGARVPLNAITWQIDGSNVYGSTDSRLALLRSDEGGKLKVSDDPTSARDLLPQAHEDAVMAGDIEGGNPVYLAGDIRANENPNLLSMHTLFVREHNYWAAKLAEQHPDWDDDQLFDGARQIVEYEMQKITYEEWLPHLLGDAVGEDQGHNPDADGQMSVEFTTAAFRLGHTLVSEDIDSVNDQGGDDGSTTLMDAFFNHTGVQANGIDSLLRGQLSNTAQEVDAQVVDALNFFLETPDGTSGFSLPALNIGRGLDHGLQSYVETRAALLGDIDPDTLDPQDFSIITSDPDTQARLADAFDDVFQVDLWTGGLAEDAVEGTQLGALFTHIVADQFERTRAADETFGDLDPALGTDIIAEVTTSRFADIITRNTDVDMVQDDVFLAQDRSLTEADVPEGTWQDNNLLLEALYLQGDVETHGGNDTVALSGGTELSGSVLAGIGDDLITQTSGEIFGSVAGENGHDTIEISGTGRVFGGISGGAGDDHVILSDIARVFGGVKTESGDDRITLKDITTVHGNVRAGSGDDVVRLGAETGVLGDVRAGDGDDRIVVEAGAGAAELNGGDGFDRLTVTGNYHIEEGPEPGSGTIIYLDDMGAPTGQTLSYRNIESVTCFTLGTYLVTAQGKTQIESLQIGDRVWTLDRGLQPIRWIGRTTVPALGAFAPIRIAKNALGNGRDLWVSPQHRMMMQDWRVDLYAGTDDPVLAPAKGLINDCTIRPTPGGLVTYIHIAFDAHEIVFAEGIPSESLQVGAGAMNSLPVDARAELTALFPELGQSGGFDTARPVLTVQEARVMFAKSCA
ncbi:MAG: peroxidase family protein [Pseudomonadota bacterium]